MSARNPEWGWWLWIPVHAIVCTLALVAAGAALREAVEPLSPVIADYASRVFVLVGILVGAWFADSTCKAFARWLYAREVAR